MPLKVRINGQSKLIANTLKPLYTFVNGEKKELTKGITFINGEKTYIWGKGNISATWIPIVITPDVVPVWISDENLVVSYKSENPINLPFGYIRRYNISGPTVLMENAVLNGQVTSYSTPNSTTGELHFYGVSKRSRAESGSVIYYCVANEIIINNATGEITTTNSMTVNDAGPSYGTTGQYDTMYPQISGQGFCYMDGYWFGRGGFATGRPNTYDPTNRNKWYSVNGSYNYLYKSTGVFPVKVDDTYLIAPDSSNGQIYRYSTSGNSSVITPTTPATRCMVANNGNIVLTRNYGYALYDDEFNLIEDFGSDSSNYRTYYLIGIVRDNFYLLDRPYDSNSSDQNSYILAVSAIDGSQVMSQEITFPINTITDVVIMPYISQNSLLTFCVYDSANSANKYFAKVTTNL